MKKLIQVKNVVKTFDKQVVLKGISLDIYENEFVTLLGPSGCGKTTLLRIIAGFLEPSEGHVIMDGEDIAKVPAYKRDVNTVFQHYALFPHLNVYENIAFGLKIKKQPKDIIDQKVRRMISLVGLEGFEKRDVTKMSGGQQQRVAIARALIKNPRVLLLDEPLSNLDARLRIEMREEIRRIQQETKITTIFVTHDQEEAMSISDKIVLMKDGVLQQKDDPQNLYDEPVNCFVADFLGNPPINKTHGVVKDGKIVLDGDYTVEIPGVEKIADGTKVTMSMRAESIVVDENGTIEATVDTKYVIGKEVLAYLDLGAHHVRAYVPAEKELQHGEKVKISLKKTGVFVFDETSGERLL